jgi:hypothetical protein
MPTILWYGPYRFHFYSHVPNVHVDRDDLSAKFLEAWHGHFGSRG